MKSVHLFINIILLPVTCVYNIICALFYFQKEKMPPKRKATTESSKTLAKKAKIKKTATKPVKKTTQKTSKAKTKTENKKTEIKTTNSLYYTLMGI